MVRGDLRGAIAAIVKGDEAFVGVPGRPTAASNQPSAVSALVLQRRPPLHAKDTLRRQADG